ncbi:molybdopterin-binding protein, partial [Amycolatopsis bartoniae]
MTATGTSTTAPPARTRLGIVAAALCGVLALLAALAVGHLAAGFISVNASPYLAVGNGAIDLTPVELKDFAVRTFGTHDKLVLLSGMAVVLVVAAALAGVASRRSPWPGTVVVALFGVLGIVAVAVRPDLGPVAVLAPLASLVAGVVVFRLLHHAARGTGAGPREGSSRRSFLLAGAGALAGSAVVGV